MIAGKMFAGGSSRAWKQVFPSFLLIFRCKFIYANPVLRVNWFGRGKGKETRRIESSGHLLTRWQRRSLRIGMESGAGSRVIVVWSRADKSKVWNAAGRISAYLWRWQFNDTHSRSRVIVNISIRSIPTTHAHADELVQPTVLYESSGRIWQRDAPGQLLLFIRALHYSVTESSVTS